MLKPLKLELMRNNIDMVLNYHLIDYLLVIREKTTLYSEAGGGGHHTVVT